MTILIDAHQHFWSLARGDYFWMPEDNDILSRPYAPRDLKPELAACGIKATVLVQAAPTVEETEYMLGLADATDFVAGVVGWVDFENPDHLRHITRLAKHPKFVGVRPMIQDIEDVDWMLRADLDWAFRALIDHGLRFDALGFPQHMANFLTLFKRYPELAVVINHCMKPQVADAAYDGWADDMSALAEETSANCKLSGLVTEAGDDFGAERLQPYVSHVAGIFGYDRLMYGSDWPVARLKCEYRFWFDLCHDLLPDLTPEQSAALYGGTAMRFYDLTVN